MGARHSEDGSRVVALSAVTAVFMIAQQIASKAVRDGFFLSQFDVTSLPLATFAAAFVSFGAALLFGKFNATFTPRAAVPVLFASNGLLFLAEAMLVSTEPRFVAWAIYLHTAAFGGAVVSGFWSVINERFDPYSARQVMGRIAGGATFGGVVGGVLTWIFSDVSTSLLLSTFGASSMVCAVTIGWVARGMIGDRDPREPTALLSGVRVIVANSYPRTIGVLVFLGALMTGTVDYVFKAGVAGQTSTDGLVGFFAFFYTVVGIATFGLQAVGSQRVLKWLGVVPTVALFPLVALVLLAFAVLAPGFASVVLLRGGAMVVENSLYRSGYELLYTAVPRAQKRSAKVLIDLGFDRLGTAAASGLVLLLIAASAVVELPLLLIAGVVAVLSLGTLTVLRRGYVASLADQLRAAAESEHSGSPDAAARALASTFVAETDIWAVSETGSITGRQSHADSALSFADLMADVRRRAAEKRLSSALPSTWTALPTSTVKEELLATPLRTRLRHIGPDAAEWEDLRRSAPGTLGQLGDILLTAREPLEARLRAAQLLAGVPSPRSAAALLAALRGTELQLRRTAALALHIICEVAPALQPPRAELVELAGAELMQPSAHVAERIPFELKSMFRLDGRGNEISPSLELVFILLAIDGETDDLRLALSAITSDDTMRRGTGLEYLDNLLPSNLRPRLLALAESPELTQANRRVSSAVVADLAARLRSGELELVQLRAEYRERRREEYDRG